MFLRTGNHPRWVSSAGGGRSNNAEKLTVASGVGRERCVPLLLQKREVGGFEPLLRNPLFK